MGTAIGEMGASGRNGVVAKGSGWIGGARNSQALAALFSVMSVNSRQVGDGAEGEATEQSWTKHGSDAKCGLYDRN